ncbi:putative fructokinase [Geobacillus sp. BCO2]|nr:putative fructokinase [Geobacillus sp. BCO2]
MADRHEVWELEAFYLAQAITNYILVLSPKKVITGGGVMKQTHVLPLVRRHVQKWLGGYIRHEAILEKIDEYIVPQRLGTMPAWRVRWRSRRWQMNSKNGRLPSLFRRWGRFLFEGRDFDHLFKKT